MTDKPEDNAEPEIVNVDGQSMDERLIRFEGTHWGDVKSIVDRLKYEFRDSEYNPEFEWDEVKLEVKTVALGDDREHNGRIHAPFSLYTQVTLQPIGVSIEKHRDSDGTFFMTRTPHDDRDWNDFNRANKTFKTMCHKEIMENWEVGE